MTTPAYDTPGYDSRGAAWALEALRDTLQGRVERAEWRLRGEAELAARAGEDVSLSLFEVLGLYRRVHLELDGARASAEIFANHPLPFRVKERREEEAASLSDRVQTALDNENRPPSQFRQFNVRDRADEAHFRAHGRRHPTPAVPAVSQSRARSPRARGKEGRDRER